MNFEWIWWIMIEFCFNDFRMNSREFKWILNELWWIRYGFEWILNEFILNLDEFERILNGFWIILNEFWIILNEFNWIWVNLKGFWMTFELFWMNFVPFSRLSWLQNAFFSSFHFLLCKCFTLFFTFIKHFLPLRNAQNFFRLGLRYAPASEKPSIF